MKMTKKSTEEALYKSTFLSPIGEITYFYTQKALIGLWIEGQNYDAQKFENAKFVDNSNLPIFRQINLWLEDYFAGNNPTIEDIPLALDGTKFQQDVWKILLEIPYGETTTYKDIANQIAQKYKISKMSAQAVGSAVGKNPISIIVPCHRVIGSNGALIGYAGGIDKKEFLLNLEKANQL